MRIVRCSAVGMAAVLLLWSGLLLPVPADAQILDSREWTYGGAMSDLGASVRETADGGFIVAGSSNSFGPGDFDVYLLRFSPAGILLWETHLGTPADEFGADVVETGDGGFLVAGWSWSPENSTDVYLVRTDANGNGLWEQGYGGSGSDYGYAVLPLEDGGYAIAGSTSSSGTSVDMYLIRIRDDGTGLWEKTYGGNGDEYGFSILSPDDGGFVIAGSTTSFGTSSDIFLVRASPDGTELWEQHYGGQGIQEGRAVVGAGDGGFLIAGGTDPVPSGAWDACLVRIDSQGRLLWEQPIGGTGNDYGTAVVMNGDDGFFLAGRTGSYGPSTDVFLVRGSPLGNSLWEMAFGGARYDAASALRETSDGGLVIAGTTESFGRGDDVYLIRLVPPSGTLVVTSTPPGATLSLDGVSRGETPLTLVNVSAGLHTIRLRYPGYGEYRGEIQVISGASPTVVDAILEAIPETPSPTVTPSPTPSSLVGGLIPARPIKGSAEGETGFFFPFRLLDFSRLFSLF